MKSFIAGCGRSGTTLIRDLMGCFEDTYVYTEGAYGEAPFSSFSKIFCPESNVVIKRTGECWRTLASLPDDIGLIYCVRHPFDVLTSTHPLTKHLRRFHITFDRWTMEYDAWHTLRKKQPNPKVFILKYEELIAKPDVVQTQLSKHFNFTVAHTFSENRAGIRIFSDSIEKWKKDPVLFKYLNTFPARLRRSMADFCEEFGYSLPAGYADGTAETNLPLQVLSVINPNGLETLDNLPFFWIGGAPTHLDVYAAFNGEIRLMFDAIPGPCFDAHVERHLRVTSGNWSVILAVQPGAVAVSVPVSVGENELILEAVEQATIPVLPNGDTRPLILGVRNMQIVESV